MRLLALAEWLEAQGFGDARPAAAGGAIYLNRVPHQPDNLVSLFATGGFADTGDYDEAEPNPTVQVRVRDSDPEQAETRSWALWQALNRLHGVALSDGTHIINTEALQPPTWLQRDQTGRVEYVFNVRFRVALEGE